MSWRHIEGVNVMIHTFLLYLCSVNTVDFCLGAPGLKFGQSSDLP